MILEGKASDILWDYTEGRYTLHIDQMGDLQFEDEYGARWELDPQVQYYINLIELYCPCSADLDWIKEEDD